MLRKEYWVFQISSQFSEFVAQKYLIWGAQWQYIFSHSDKFVDCGISCSANTGSNGDGRIVKLLLRKPDHQHKNVLDFVSIGILLDFVNRWLIG